MLIHAAQIFDILVFFNKCKLTNGVMSNVYPNSVQQLSQMQW